MLILRAAMANLRCFKVSFRNVLDMSVGRWAALSYLKRLPSESVLGGEEHWKRQ